MNTSPLEPKSPALDKQQIRVRRGRVESVDLYEIKENELELLEKGAPSGLFLNFAIFLLSLAFCAITALSTATFANPSMETLFLIVSVVGVLGGVFLFILWWRTRESIAQVVRDIRGRIPRDIESAKPSTPSSDVTPKG
jgi:hypothetical protein